MSYKTQGEMYEFKPGERENIERLNVILREGYAKLMEAKKFIEEVEANAELNKSYIYWGFGFYWETDDNGEPKLPSNYSTDIDISVRVNDEWMSSTNFC